MTVILHYEVAGLVEVFARRAEEVPRLFSPTQLCMLFSVSRCVVHCVCVSHP